MTLTQQPESVQTAPLATLRPRNLWDILDDTFDMYRRRFALFAGATAVIYVPVYIVFIAVMTNVMQRLATVGQTKDPYGILAPLFSGLAISVPLLGLAYVVQTGVTTRIVEETLRGRETDMKSAFRQTIRFLWPLALSSFFVMALVTVGLCGLYIGAFFMLAALAFVPQAVVLENKGAVSSLSRSWNLCRAGFGTSFGMLLLIGLITGSLSSGISGIFEGITLLVPGANEAAKAAQNFAIRQAISSVVGILLAPILGIATTLLYYDLRVRREGLDIVAQAESIGFPLVPDAFGDAVAPRIGRTRP